MTITKIRKARAGAPDKIGEDMQKGKKSGEDVRERKEIGRSCGKGRKSKEN